MHGVLALVVLGGAPMLLVLAPAAYACSCAVASVQPDRLLRSEVVFEGRAVGRDVDVWTFDVSRVYRGPVTARQLVVTDDDSASCGASLALGRPYLIDGRADRDDPDAVRTGLCSMTQTTAAWTPSDRREVVQRVGPGTAPPPVTAGDSGAGVDVGAAVAVAVVTAVLAVAATVLFRARRHR